MIRPYVLFRRNILIYIFVSEQRIIQNICGAEQYHDVARHVAACPVGDKALKTDHDGETEYHRHEDTRCHRGVFA